MIERESGAVKSYRVWLDLETTGLNPEHDLILEVGIIVTDRPTLAVHKQERWVIGYPEGVLKARSNEWSTKQHKASGLWDEVVKEIMHSDEVWKQVAHRLGEFKEPYPTDPTRYHIGPMCGATVSFDRAFLRKRTPTIEALFHYRNLDVSAYREHLSMLGIDCPPKRDKHRTIEDLEDSIELARFVSQLFLRGARP